MTASITGCGGSGSAVSSTTADNYNYVYVSTLGVTGVVGSGNGRFSTPYGVTVDGLGNVYVADTTNQRIQKYDSSGTYMSTLEVTGVSGSDNSHFIAPVGVAVDGSGNVYVADYGTYRIQKYSLAFKLPDTGQNEVASKK